MRRPSRTGLSLVFACCAGIPLAAQNLEAIGKEKPFSFSGGIAVNHLFYGSTGIAARRQSYRYVASGTFNLSLYGWTIPLTFSFADRRATFAQPFNRYAVHPNWKWVSAHAGYTSMSFSPYTVNGHTFLGAAADLTPGERWKISALYGRLLKATKFDSSSARPQHPAYQRYGWGVKVSYGTDANFVDVIAFRAKDDESTVPTLPDSLGVAPQENLVLSLGGGKTIFRHLLLKAELAASALTRDTRAGKIDNPHPLANTRILFAPRLSSSYYQAFKTSLAYRKHSWLLGLGYERIDPGYRTLGAYYFNSDLSNITINGSAGMLKGKLNIAGSAGIQRDNLDETKISTMRRVVASLNVNYTPSAKFNLAASYSGFQSFTHIRSQFEDLNQLTPYENPDTLNFTQVSRNASCSGMYALSATETRRQHVSMQLSWQDASDAQGQANPNNGARFYNIHAGYTLSLIPQHMSFALAFATTISKGPFMHTQMMGPTLSVTRSFLQRRIRTSLSSAYNRTRNNGMNINGIFNIRWSGVCSLAGRHNLQFNAIMVKRTAYTASAGRSFTEFTGTLGYGYRFGK